MIDHGSKCAGQPCTCPITVTTFDEAQDASWILWNREQEKAGNPIRKQIQSIQEDERCRALTDDGRGPSRCVFPDHSHPSYCKTEDGRYFNRV